MPYIVDKEKKDAMTYPKGVGQLNFRLTTQFLEYIKRNGESYKHYNDILAVLTDPFRLPKPERVDEPNNLTDLATQISFIVRVYLDNSKNIQGTRDLEIRGVFFACALEFYRRMVALYEGEKIIENGDVFPKVTIQMELLEAIKAKNKVIDVLADSAVKMAKKFTVLQQLVDSELLKSRPFFGKKKGESSNEK